ncbi:hydrolase [Pseudarthrobacter sp. MDT3-28]|uniref:nitrilase-related carbon-nitrogen hydrolase n=1 Tax=Pseudarthrobacter raffinosi TaxID=2953651 RepID=UPI00208EB517|nr:nitrilase-related carbon-nitrogen hydrolase [Pseudarthrobacter sp. MDT3-28]MCO4236742.1 hydrolase [Pseudarthrobacter sp. MDT3-28]
MTQPYTVVALSPVQKPIREPEDALENTKRIIGFMKTAVGVAATEGAPVKLVVIPEMAIQGMHMAFTAGNREAEKKFARTIPGPETDELGKAARELDTYIAGELYLVADDDFPDRYFNVAFMINPQGEVIYRRAKATSDGFEGGTLGTTNPHDVWDEWIQKKGDGRIMDAIYPVAKTADIGNIGYIICHEGAYPEIARGLAMNGAEILIRATLIEPQTMNGMWETQNKAHAMFNNAIVVAPNLGPEIGPDGVLNDLFGGKSMIVDHKGQIIVQQGGITPGDTFVSTVIDIDALRRARQSNGVFNGFKDLRTEQYAAIYAEPIYPKNQYLNEPPAEGWLARERELRASNIKLLEQRGVFTPID